MRKRYSRSYTVLSFLTMFSYRELPFRRFSFDLSVQQQADNSLNVIDAYFAVAVDIAAEELLHVKCGMLGVI